MIKTIKRTIRGMGYLDSCGYHPGTSLLIVFMLMGGLAGVNKTNDVSGFLKGAGLMGASIAPIYFIGCHDRALIEEIREKKKDT